VGRGGGLGGSSQVMRAAGWVHVCVQDPPCPSSRRCMRVCVCVLGGATTAGARCGAVQLRGPRARARAPALAAVPPPHVLNPSCPPGTAGGDREGVVHHCGRRQLPERGVCARAPDPQPGGGDRAGVREGEAERAHCSAQRRRGHHPGACVGEPLGSAAAWPSSRCVWGNRLCTGALAQAWKSFARGVPAGRVVGATPSSHPPPDHPCRWAPRPRPS